MCCAGPYGPHVFDLPWPLLTKEGDDGARIASRREDEIVLLPTGNPEAPQAFTNLRTAEVELDSLQSKAEELKGGRISGLASYCRNDGLRKIVEIMDRKINSKFAMENAAKIGELCKAAITAKDEKMTAECVKAVGNMAYGRF
jgi:hypothetical protein